MDLDGMLSIVCFQFNLFIHWTCTTEDMKKTKIEFNRIQSNINRSNRSNRINQEKDVKIRLVFD